MRKLVVAVVATVGLVAAACGGDTDQTATGTPPDEVSASATESASAPASEPASESEPAASEGGATLHVVTGDLGDVLADTDGRTLYLFMPDEQGDPTCYDDCEQNWPPFLGPAEGGAGVKARLVATAPREDGSEQVTYNGWPLYYFANDEEPGDMNGQGVGDVWFMIGVDGEPIQAQSAGDGADPY